MKLIIQIPCYNEEKALPVMLKELPRKVRGFDKVEWLLIDDGSGNASVEIAKRSGVDHILSLKKNQGLAKVFIEGLKYAVDKGGMS